MLSSSNGLDLLKCIVENIETLPYPETPVIVNQNTPRPHVRAKFGANSLVGIRVAASESLFNLANLLFDNSTEFQRSTTYSELTDKLVDLLLKNYPDRKGSDVSSEDFESVEAELHAWFRSIIGTHLLYVPCVLTPYSAASFHIGPVKFMHIDDFIADERAMEPENFDFSFSRLLEAMERESAKWLALISIEKCTQARAWEIGNRAVDVAVTGIQLVVPLWGSLQMSRMTGRMNPRFRESVSRTNGSYQGGSTNEQPGLSVGSGTLELFLMHGQAIIAALGPRIESFIQGAGRLPKLEQAWADAAYWFHEGLAEPLDTIAVPKLETAVEVLLRSENASGSTTRLIKAICSFYDRTHTQLINEGSEITVAKFAKNISRDRARILHGTWPTLNHSLRVSRPTLTGLVHDLLAKYALELEIYIAKPGASDEIDNFLDAVKARRLLAAVKAE